jgi:hypothetical protein
MKSPSSMRNGRFNTSKCRGKASKMGSVVHPFSQKTWPVPQTLKNKNKKFKKGHSVTSGGPASD